MQNHRLIPYKFKSNMHLFLSRKDSLVQNQGVLPHRGTLPFSPTKQLLLGEEDK